MASPFIAPLSVEKSGTYVPVYPRTLGNIKTRIARSFGGENNPKIRELAEEGVLRAVDDVNMRHYLRFGIQTPTTSSLVSGTRTYDIPSDTFNIDDVQLLDSNGDPVYTLEYLEWGAFNRRFEDQTQTGRPEFFSVRNWFVDGEIHVYPEPDDDAASTYTLRITAYKRLDRPTGDLSIIAAPREIQDVLITYGEYYVGSVRQRDNVAYWGHKERSYRSKLAAFIRMIEREPSQDLRFRLHFDDSEYRVRDGGWQ